MGIGQSKQPYQACSDSVWSDTVTVNFDRDNTEDFSINSGTPKPSFLKTNKFVLFFKNLGGKIQARSSARNKKFDDIDMDGMPSSHISINDTFFGKFKAFVKPNASRYKTPDESDTHGLVI